MTIVGQRRSNLANPNEDYLFVWEAEDVQPVLDDNGVRIRDDIYARLILSEDVKYRRGTHRVFSDHEWQDMILLLSTRDPSELVASGYFE